MAPDRDIEGFICEDHAGDFCVHEPSDDGGIGGVAADQAMGPEQEQVAYPSDRSGAEQGRKIADFASILVCADYDLIDLVRTEPGNLDWRVRDNQFFELSFQFGNVPSAFFAQSIDRQSEQTLLRLVQVVYANAWHGRQTKQFGGLQPRIPIDHNIVFADEERDVESEPANRICYFTNVRWIILAEFTHVRFQGANGAGLDPKRRKDVVAAGRPQASFFRFRMPCRCLPA
jgi:hypothetical protein